MIEFFISEQEDIYININPDIPLKQISLNCLGSVVKKKRFK